MGLNKVYKQQEAQNFITTNNVSILVLIEHKIEEQHVSKVMRTVAPGWPWLDN